VGIDFMCEIQTPNYKDVMHVHHRIPVLTYIIIT
jgi:hypothetical protein